MRGAGFIAALALAAALLGTRAGASVFVPMSDEDLVGSSDVIVTGTVADITGRLLLGGRVVTTVTLAVEQTLLGAPGTTLVLTEPGGEVAGTIVAVDGAPDYARGERVLVFARRRADGGLATNALGLGKYRLEAPAGGEAVARRTTPAAAPRALGGFAARVAALAADRAGARADGRAGAAVEPAVIETAADAFTFARIQGFPGRWFQADCGVPVPFAQANADSVLGDAVSRGAIAAALDAWSTVPGGSLRLTVAPDGTPQPATISGHYDGRTQIQFDDPFNEVPDLVACTGVLAVGGYAASSDTTVPGLRGTLNGETWLDILEADVTVNDGFGACFPGPSLLAEVLAHEVGHAIGFAHSSENPAEPDATLADALMYYRAHDDGRGASIRADDAAGLVTAYPENAVAPTPVGAVACEFALPFLPASCFGVSLPAPIFSRYGKARTAAGRAGAAATPKKQKKQLRKALKLLKRTDAAVNAAPAGACRDDLRALTAALRARTTSVVATL